VVALGVVAACVARAPGAPDALSGAVSGDPRALGRADAPLTIIEYTDLQCPYCGAYARTTFARIRQSYVDTGKVRYESRDLPLSFHPFALPAAVAARCAGRQGKYWAFRELAAQRQSELPQSPYAAWAAQLGLDVPQLEACIASGEPTRQIEAERADAEAIGIVATPTFVLRRAGEPLASAERIEGAEPLEVFQQKIEGLLTPKAIP
jgi:protein-disulfide isomerase